MQERSLYEYAVIRVVPRVEREEFLNVGIVLYAASTKFLQVRYTVCEAKLGLIAPKLEISEIAEHLAAFERIAKGDLTAGPIALLPAPERFRWLTAVRSTIVQTSKVHSGFCRDFEEEVVRLFGLLVL
jgi:hypothetical protein